MTSTKGFSTSSELGSKDVVVWIAETDELLKHCNKFESLLSNEEKYRSKTFHFKADSKRYICAHGMLRLILAHYANSSAVTLKLTTGDYGKPRLVEFTKIKFNLSNTKELIALAVTKHREIGVDIERCVPLSNMDHMSQCIMHEDELLNYSALPHFKRTDYFYRCWVRKESILKAWGTGIYKDLRQIKVIEDASPYRSPRGVVEEQQRKKEWCIKNFYPAPGHFGAVCFEGTCADIRIVDKTTSRFQSAPFWSIYEESGLASFG